VTDKDNTSIFILDDLRSVTDNLNNIIVPIPDMVFAYRSYVAMPKMLPEEEQTVNLGDLLGEFAVLWQNDLVFLLRGSFERFLACIMEVPYADLAYPDSETYKEYFKIVKHTKISEAFYKKDILYVYDNNYMLVVTDAALAQSFRKMRGNQ
jgi:hypothetical protein